MPTFPTQEWGTAWRLCRYWGYTCPLCHTGGWQHPSPRGMTLVGEEEHVSVDMTLMGR